MFGGNIILPIFIVYTMTNNRIGKSRKKEIEDKKIIKYTVIAFMIVLLFNFILNFIWLFLTVFAEVIGLIVGVILFLTYLGLIPKITPNFIVVYY